MIVPVGSAQRHRESSLTLQWLHPQLWADDFVSPSFYALGQDPEHSRRRELGEDEDWLRDVASEMEIEDGVIWVYGVGEDGVLAFTDFGIESLIELIKMYEDDPALLKPYDPQ
jgi:hypothetical protein